MKKYHVVCLTVLLALGLIALFKHPAPAQSTQNSAAANSTASGKNDPVVIANESNTVVLTKLQDNVWVHTTYGLYNGEKIPSNGLIVNTSKGLVLLDTPWDNEETKELLAMAKSFFKKDFVLAVVTHAHADRIGGIDTLLENNIEVRSTALTKTLANKMGYKSPQPKLDAEPSFVIGDTSFETFYPGAGHTADNIVVWLPQYKILQGGCLIKSESTTDLGNITEANLAEWPVSVRKVLDKYPQAAVVIPGHGKWGGINLVKHTLALVSGK